MIFRSKNKKLSNKIYFYYLFRFSPKGNGDLRFSNQKIQSFSYRNMQPIFWTKCPIKTEIGSVG